MKYSLSELRSGVPFSYILVISLWIYLPLGILSISDKLTIHLYITSYQYINLLAQELKYPFRNKNILVHKNGFYIR